MAMKTSNEGKQASHSAFMAVEFDPKETLLQEMNYALSMKNWYQDDAALELMAWLCCLVFAEEEPDYDEIENRIIKMRKDWLNAKKERRRARASDF